MENAGDLSRSADLVKALGKTRAGLSLAAAVAWTAPAGSYICGFFGRAQDEIEKLEVVRKLLPMPDNG